MRVLAAVIQMGNGEWAMVRGAVYFFNSHDYCTGSRGKIQMPGLLDRVRLKKEQSAEGLVLGKCSDRSIHGQVSEKGFNFFLRDYTLFALSTWLVYTGP